MLAGVMQRDGRRRLYGTREVEYGGSTVVVSSQGARGKDRGAG